jgi:sulfate transport system permease protein
VADLPLTSRIDGRIVRTRRRPLASGGVAAPAAVLATASTVTFLSVIVLLPIAALLAAGIGPGFLETITQPQAVAALKFTVGASLVAVAVDVVAGLAVAWVLVRDDFRGRRLVDALVDLPFALPTIVAGLTLLALYGDGNPLGLDLAYTRAGVALALLFVTLPFVVRSVQPVLADLDPEVEEAAATLGAGSWTTFRRVLLPALLPALVAGAAQAFARALGEFGSVVLISGNLPYRTEVASWWIFTQVENGAPEAGAAVAVVLLAVALLVVVLLRVVGRRAEGRR